MVEIPALGPMVVDADYSGYRSELLPVPVLGNATCHLVVLGYGDDARVEDFDAAIPSFLHLDESVLTEAAQPVFEYYLDTKAIRGPGEEIVEISSACDVWRVRQCRPQGCHLPADHLAEANLAVTNQAKRELTVTNRP